MSSERAVSSSNEQYVQLSRGASYLVIQNLGVNGITVVAFVILARLISQKEMGIWAVLGLVNATCQALITLFPQAVTKFVAENVSKGKREAASAAFYQATGATIIMYLPVVTAIYLGAGFMASRLLGDISYTPLFQVLAFDALLFAGILPTITAAMIGLRLFREAALVGLAVGGFLRQFLIILLLVLMRNFLGLVIGWLISDATTVAIYFVLVARTLGSPTFDFPLSKLFRYSLPLELGGIAQYAQTWFDRALLIVFVPLASLGIYNVALTAFSVLQSVSGGINNMLLPAYSSLDTRSRAPVRDAARLATRYSTLILVPLAFGLFSTAKASLALFVGESYVAGYLSLMIFCGAFAFSAFAMALNPLLLALEKTRTAAWVTCLTVITGLGVAYTILPKYGILGAAVARALTIILSSILIALVVRKSVGSSLDLSAVAKTLIAGTTMATVVGVVQLLTYNKFMLPIYFLIGATVYLTMLRLLNAVEIADMDLLRRLLGNRLSLVSGFISWLLLSRDSRVKYRSQ